MTLLFLVGVVVGCHVTATLAHKKWDVDSLQSVRHLFELDGELNVPAIFSSALLLLAGVLALRTALSRPVDKTRVFWWLMAAGFHWMSFDELLSIHEKLTEPMRELLGTSGVLYHAWVLPYTLVAIVAAAILFPGFLRLPRSVKWMMCAAGAIFLSGAIGVEMIAGWEVEHSGHKGNLLYAGLVILEETMEMIGVVILIHAITVYRTIRPPVAAAALPEISAERG